MPNLDQVNQAIAAHSAWKARLRAIIASGKSDLPVQQICRDDQCDFGKWLKNPALPRQLKSSHHFREVVQLHAVFHESAGHTATLALAGKANEAEATMQLGGEFSKASSELINAMMVWQAQAST
jgi:Chemoreceptor zinc-binding domain